VKKKLFLIIVLAVTMTVAYQQRVPHILIGKYLSPADVLIKADPDSIGADAIVVVSGDNDRMKHAIDLYKQGYAPKLILSGGAKEGFTSDAKTMQLEASRSGISNEVVILEEKANNTYENTLFTKEIVKSQGFKSLILVTSPYHQRRVYETFKSVFRGSDVTFQNSPSIYSSWKADSWWKSEKETNLTQEEIIKTLWAKLTGNYK